ncbi:MAG: suppressor of fused domain protein [Pseudomonadales bacterium]|nr:suppressor of fused domain protein [Pseudomonadales bacterium]
MKLEHNRAAIPTPRMKALYRHFTDKWGEPDHLIWFDPNQATRNCTLKKIHIGAWLADEDCDVNSFVSFGMSETEMGHSGSGKRAELQFAVRGLLSKTEIHEIARFLANVAEYPFMNSLELDWWHSIRDAGSVPCFPKISKILFRPPFTESANASTSYNTEMIKFLFLVPLSEAENQILSTDGPGAYEQYMTDNGFDLLGHK